MGSNAQVEEWRGKIDQMKGEIDAEKVLSKMEVEKSQTEIDIFSIIRKYGGSTKDHSWANELKDHAVKPSYLAEIESESARST